MPSRKRSRAREPSGEAEAQEMLARLLANLVTTCTPRTPCTPHTNKGKSDDIAEDPDIHPETLALKAFRVFKSLEADTMAALSKAFTQTLPTSSRQVKASPT